MKQTSNFPEGGVMREVSRQPDRSSGFSPAEKCREGKCDEDVTSAFTA